MSKKSENKHVKFVVSPTGAFNLAYSAGEHAELGAALAEELVDSGYAQFCDEEGNLLGSSETDKSIKQDKATLKLLTEKAKKYGIEVPAGATADAVQDLIDKEFETVLSENKLLKGDLEKLQADSKKPA